MSKRTFVICAVVAVLLAVFIPLWAYLSDASEDSGAHEVPASLRTGRDLFETNCGTCHTLYAAGTDGNFAPDLDKLLAPTGQATDASTIKATKTRVLNAINDGVDSSTPGRMPAGILSGEPAEQVANFVSREAGK
jgi:mono/diheme cytochrome c family protein